ncbi:MAG TPA: cytochrome P450, partial [Isosphaeraceae bacterium]|nr:cytochrome P450 [Isosphaeraceae bacterium]
MAVTTETSARRPPGPRGHWLFGNLRQFKEDRLRFLDECFETYGDVVSIRLGPIRAWLLNHPDLVEEVLVTKNRLFVKHFALRRTRRTLGKGLLTSEGDFWRAQRRLSQPAFHRDRVASYAAIMVDYAERMLQDWHDGQTLDAQDAMMQLTLQIVAKTLFDADVSGESGDASAAMETLLHAFTNRIDKLIKIPEKIPTPANRRMERAARRLDGILYRIIEEHRKSGDRGDLLSMLLRAQDEDTGRRMTDAQLRDEAMTLFMAGHETTANTLAWAWYLLSKQPEAETKLHAELDDALTGRSPSIDDLPRLKYAEAVISETLRIMPTVWIVGREATEPCEVGGYPVPRGTTLYMSQWVLHRDSRWFDDPLTFRPERWLDGLAKRLPRYAYFPFGGGPRVCIGNQFALMESVLLLSTIARRFRLEL